MIIGLYEGSRSWAKAEAQGFKVYTAAEAAKQADVIMILINDEKQADMYKNDIEPNLEEGNMLMFAHGFNIHFGCIKPPEERGRYHDRSEGAGSHGKKRVPGRQGNPLPDRCRAGCHRKGMGPRAGIRSCHRRSERQDFLRRPSGLRQRQTSSASRLFCAAACAP